MAPVQITQMGVDDIAARLKEPSSAIAMHRDAVERGLPFGRYLELLNPSEKGDSLDAFERQMKRAGIVVNSDPAMGVWASRASEFKDSPTGRALYPEFFARQYRKATGLGRQQQRSIQLAGDNIPGGWAQPYALAAQARWDDQIAPAIPLSELIAMTTPVDQADYRALYLTTDAAAVRKYRIGESADIPVSKLADSERTIRLKKYGRGIQASYEQLRRIRVDKMAWFIQMTAIQDEIDKVAAALTVLVSGDGNSGTTPTSYNLTTLDSAASAGTLTLKGWIAFKMKFAQPYMITTALMQEAVALQLALLNTGSGNVPLVAANLGGLGTGLTPINQFADGVRYGWTTDAPTLKIVGVDRRMALEYVTEIGADITETERYIVNQTEIMVMSEVNGFAVMDPGATKILDVNA